MKRVIPAIAAALSLAACQTYDFERVVPLAVSQESQSQVIVAKSLKPNIMLLVDNSGSMTEPVASGGTRIDNLKSAMADFLGEAGTLARFGLTVFPENGVGSQTVRVALPAPTSTDDGTDATLSTQANAVNDAIQLLTPAGGTPTAASLAFVGEEPGLNNTTDNRADFVLLLTDGLPNLNNANPNAICDCGTTCDQARKDACACTQGSCDSPGLCAVGCLDRDATVDTITGLYGNKSIGTIVIGFGDDLTTGDAADVLNAMARAGKQPRKCTEQEPNLCGNTQTCDSDKICSQAFYQAANSDELKTALRAIIDQLKGDPCKQTLASKPSDPRFIAVVVDGVTIQACTTDTGCNTYFYDGDKAITILGSTCDKLHNSTAQNPVKLEIRAVEKL